MVAGDERRADLLESPGGAFMFTLGRSTSTRLPARYATGTARGVGRCSVGAVGEVRLILVPVEKLPNPLRGVE